jgi:hypothetical protein
MRSSRGVATARQYLIARRDDMHGLELVRTVESPNVTHLKFARC